MMLLRALGALGLISLGACPGCAQATPSHAEIEAVRTASTTRNTYRPSRSNPDIHGTHKTSPIRFSCGSLLRQ